MLQPTVRRTWAPKGQTPVHYTWDRRDRLSAISAVTVSPKRRRLGLYFALFDRNINTDRAESFVADLLTHFPKGIILVWDRWMVHRSAAKRLHERFPKRVRIEWLPPYAPDLNPDEQVWNRTKYSDLANYIPNDIHSLAKAVNQSLCDTKSHQTLLRSFFRHAELSL
jgi:transposase